MRKKERHSFAERWPDRAWPSLFLPSLACRLVSVSVLLFGSCHLILIVSSTNSIQIVRRQCCLLPWPIALSPCLSPDKDYSGSPLGHLSMGGILSSGPLKNDRAWPSLFLPSLALSPCHLSPCFWVLTRTILALQQIMGRSMEYSQEGHFGWILAPILILDQ